MQKLCRAGILVKEPTKKANASQMAAVVMLGPTYFKALDNFFSTDKFLSWLPTAFLIMNILSTPIARIRKGITSTLIIVYPTLKYELTPREQTTEQITIKIPCKAKENPLYLKDGNFPIATPTYKNMIK